MGKRFDRDHVGGVVRKLGRCKCVQCAHLPAAPSQVRRCRQVNLQPFRASHLLARALRLSPCSCKSLVRGLGKPGETLCASMSPFAPKPFTKCLMRLESSAPLGSANLSKNLIFPTEDGVPVVSRESSSARPTIGSCVSAGSVLVALSDSHTKTFNTSEFEILPPSHAFCRVWRLSPVCAKLPPASSAQPCWA